MAIISRRKILSKDQEGHLTKHIQALTQADLLTQNKKKKGKYQILTEQQRQKIRTNKIQSKDQEGHLTKTHAREHRGTQPIHVPANSNNKIIVMPRVRHQLSCPARTIVNTNIR